MKRALLLLALLALPASAQHKPWFVGVQKTGATQWTPPVVSLQGGFPVSNTRNLGSGSSTTMVSSSFTADSGNVIYVVLAVHLNTGAYLPPSSITNSGTALTWTSVEAQTLAGVGYPNQRGVYIWRAVGDGAARTVTITISSTSTWQAALSIWSFSNASTGTNAHNGGQADATQDLTVTVTGVTSGSYIVGGGLSDTTTAQTALDSGTTIVAHEETGGIFANPATWQSTSTTTASSVTIGSQLTAQGYYAKAAAEIKTP